MDSAATILAKRYARAYMDLDRKVYSPALEAAALEKLESLLRVFTAAAPHRKVLTHPAINSEVKLEVLGKILGAGFVGPAAAFTAMLVRQNRFGLYELILQECRRLNYDFRGILLAEVYSRYPLSEGEVKRINKLLVNVTGKKISLRQVISERVIGGFEIKVGDALIDATVRGRLEALRAGLLKA